MACKGKGPNVSGGFMNSFIALYYGESIGAARVIAVSASPKLVREFASRMLDDASSADDLVLRSVDDGRRRALQLIREEGGTSGI
jgi:hypothetical protein